jgi:diacylglycerol kinase (ATP)
MQETILFIINPISGTRSKHNLPDLIDRYLNKQRYKIEIAYTQFGGHATELAAEAVARGVLKIIAVGGDGTIHETAIGILGTPAALGMIPVGSGNGLARHLRIPLEPERAIRLLNTPTITSIDCGKLNEHWFFNIAGLGFDAHVAETFAKLPTRGLKTYMRAVWQDWKGYRPAHYKITRKGEKLHHGHLFLLAFANGSQYGNNASVAPRAKIRDGKMDLVLLKPFPVAAVPGLAYDLFRKSFNTNRYVGNFAFEGIEIEISEPVPFHLDGEPAGILQNAKVEIVQHHLNVLVPTQF